MEPIDYLRGIRRRWPAVVAAVLIGAVMGWFGSRVASSSPSAAPSPTFSATAILLDLGSTSSSTSGGFDAGLETLVTLATLGEVPDRVADKLKSGETGSQLAQKVAVKGDVANGLLRITATSTDAEEAQLLANTFATALIEFLDDYNARIVDKAEKKLLERISEVEAEIEELEQGIESATPQERELLSINTQNKTREYGILLQQYQQLAAASATPPRLDILQKASPQEELTVTTIGPTAPGSRVSKVVIGALIGFLAGLFIALVLEKYDTKLRTKEDAEKYYGYPVLAEIPSLSFRRRKELSPDAAGPQTPFLDTFRLLATVISLASARLRDKGAERRQLMPAPLAGGAGTAEADIVETAEPLPKVRTYEEIHSFLRGAGFGDAAAALLRRDLSGHQRTILITSARKGEGKTTMVANLAASLAELGNKVTILSCDFQNPQIHKLFGLTNTPGLAEALDPPSGPAKLNGHIRQTSLANVRLVPSGAPREKAGELLNSQGMRTALDQVRSEADYVLIDTGPVLATGEATLLFPLVDAVLVVGRAGKTTREVAQRMHEFLDRLGAPVIGVALNGADAVAGSYYRYGMQPSRRFLKRREPEEDAGE